MSWKNFRRKKRDLSSPYSDTSSTSRTASVVDDGIDGPKGLLGLTLLFSPSEPHVDIIFVHGLGGGSRKTWSKTSSLSHFWPQEWLPKDAAFKDARIYSYGYNSDYVKGKDNCLNIHHFGKSLLGEIGTSPHLANTDTPIILIGHSMGGLVIKKAYVLAKQDVLYKSLSKRFYAIYFLATPHRGSASAKALKNILHLVFSQRPYVDDLQKGSKAIQVINDEFRQCSAGVDLWSFYETQHLAIGMFSRLIVDPDSAVLGFREEKQMPMNADHRSICKFDTPRDPNYLVLRNALTATINSAIKRNRKSKDDSARAAFRYIDNHLGISTLALNVGDDLATVKDARIPETCEWFSTKMSYLTWRDSTEAPRILWVSGLPASGKSVLAGYIVDQLQSNGHGLPCSYFFFKHGDKTKSQLGNCLRSLAFQMACADSRLRDTVLELLRDTTLDDDSDRSLWRKLFTEGIFQSQFSKHYWIIDALDECSDFLLFFDSMLAKLDLSMPLRILVTSRRTAELEKLFARLGTEALRSEFISSTDTLPDIKRVVEAKSKSLVVKDDAHRSALAEQVLLKSQGSFLWADLVMNELSNSYTEETISEALRNVPREMGAFYKRILASMTQSTRSKNLVQAILIWVACATRPLTTTELEEALMLDIHETLVGLDETIAALCGQLVVVDRFGRVQMVHTTAREFLLDEGLESDLATDPTRAHTRIAKACLQYLTGEEMKPPRTARRGSIRYPGNGRAAFSRYACDSFSYHLTKAHPGNGEIFMLIEVFLKSNVLSWIETVARTCNISPLIRVAKHLRIYLLGVLKERSTPGRDTRTIEGWTTDLVRIAAKFAGALIPYPPAIYSLVLPFCPTESIASTVHKAVARGRKLSLLGLSNTQWDDRIACIDFRQSRTSAISHGDEFFAVGLQDGRIDLYHTGTYQLYKTLQHGEMVRFLHFNAHTDLLASCGMKSVRIWNIRNGDSLYTIEPPPRPINLVFDSDILIIGSCENYLASWDLANHATRRDRPWNSGDDTSGPFRGQPSAISISLGHGMLAVAYVNRPIMLWDLEADTYYGSCGKKTPDGETSTYLVTALVFNPNKAIELLAASYLDEELVLVDPFSDQEIAKTRATCHALAASHDGRLLGSGGGRAIDIFEFDTLRLLYRIRSSDSFIKQISFSRDNLHLADIRGSQCDVWEPAIGGSEIEDSTGCLIETGTPNATVNISALTIDSKGGVIFCGKDDGSVCTYDLKTGKQQRTLYQHKCRVRVLEWWPHSLILMSADISSAVFTWTLKKSADDNWVTNNKIFQSRLDQWDSIMQILANPNGDKFLLSTRDSDHIWDSNGDKVADRQLEDFLQDRRWLQHPQSAALLICIDLAIAKIYRWNDSSEVGTIYVATASPHLQLKSVIAVPSGRENSVLLEVSERNGSAETQGLHLFDAASFGIPKTEQSTSMPGALSDNPDTGSMTDHNGSLAVVTEPLFGPHLQALSSCAAHVIGFSDSGKLVFLDKKSWVCSMDIDNSVTYSRHFFVPYDWFAGTRHILCGVGEDVVFARNGDVKQYLWTWNTLFTLKEKYPKHTQAVHHAQEDVCLLGYAVIQRGVRKLLREVALKYVTDAFDILLRFFCEGAKGRQRHEYLTVQTALLHHRCPSWSY
ncbi:hypothetical protein Hte_004409 [Hypoxylon texense]